MATRELRASMREELLALIRTGSPAFFQTLVLDLLHARRLRLRAHRTRAHARGDGRRDRRRHLAGRALGLEKVYVQPKRHAGDHQPAHDPGPSQGTSGAVRGSMVARARSQPA